MGKTITLSYEQIHYTLLLFNLHIKPPSCLKQMWQLTKAIAEIKCEHWTKRWNWSSCTKLALRASWTHGLIVQSVRWSEWNSLVMGPNPTQANFLDELQKQMCRTLCPSLAASLEHLAHHQNVARARIWKFLLIDCFPLTYDLNCFNSRINRQLLTVGSL